MTEVQADTSSNKDNSNSNRSTVSSSSAYNNKLENVLILQGLVVECRDEKVAHETHYYADPFEPPEWRSQWVERELIRSLSLGKENNLNGFPILDST